MSHVRSASPADDLYEHDLVLWSHEQARLLEERRFGELDLDHLIDEVRSVGSSERREIRKRLSILIAHLLKWRYQPGRRTNSWSNTIRDQRSDIEDVLDASPSLRRYLADVIPKAFVTGRLRAAKETGIDFTLFPEQLPFTADEVMDPEFLPREPERDGQP